MNNKYMYNKMIERDVYMIVNKYKNKILNIYKIINVLNNVQNHFNTFKIINAQKNVNKVIHYIMIQIFVMINVISE